jgi:phenylacetate-CoA ligase
LSYQKKLIEQAFQCPVQETYGMAEIVAAASECEFGNLHLFPDVGILENLDFKSNLPVVDGQTGEFVCTSLLNQDMPLIRYRIGDAGNVSHHLHCECARNMPILTKIEGRTDDMVLTPDGKQIGRMDPIFKTDINILEGQIIQETLDFTRVKVVPMDGFNNEDVQDIIQRVHQRLGESVRVEVELVDEIPRTKTGKFKAVVSHLQS